MFKFIDGRLGVPSYQSMASPDVRIRVRESVIRVRISETAIRAVIRIPAPQDQLIPLYLPPSPVGSLPEKWLRGRSRFVARPELSACRFLRKDGGFLFQRTFGMLSLERRLVTFKFQPRLQIADCHNKQGEPRGTHPSARKRQTSAHKRGRNSRR